MNKSFEKILERLDEMIHPKQLHFCKCARGRCRLFYNNKNCMDCVVKLAKEIVQEVAEEYNDGWIACSEKLPELRQDVLVTVKYTGFMGMHGYWIKTGHMEAENDWWGDCAGGEVIAWQPLPKPFQKGDNNENS